MVDKQSNVATVSSSGLITGAVAGAARIIASSGSLHGEVQVVVVPGDPAKIVIYAGDAQNGSIGGQLPAPLCTNVKDAAGNLLFGAIVTYTVATGGGRIADPTTPPTNNDGIAISGTWTLGPNAGTQTVTASSPGAGTVTFIATAR